MKQHISPFQFSMLVGNFIFSSTLITQPQVLIQLSKQNIWIVVLLSFCLNLLLIPIFIGNENNLSKVEGIFDDKSLSWIQKNFAGSLFVFFFFVFIRDFNSIIYFISSVLLPKTPLDIISILIILCLIYISNSGIEVIARITVVHFFIIFLTVLGLPPILLNEIQLGNLLPVGGVGSVREIGKSMYLMGASIGEMIVMFFLLNYVKPFKKIKKATIKGISMFFAIFFISSLLDITVLGVGVAKESTYPNFLVVQQIHLTDFLDRLDLVIVLLWLPTVFCKLALVLYAIQKCSNTIIGRELKFTLLPLGLLLALCMHLFKDNIEGLEFAFITWPTLGLLLEVIIFAQFLWIKRKQTGSGKGSKDRKNVKA
ncbi:GerAB/ArcD/ProY family transporter [Robertmurraya andreesenii]|uniref:Spore germination protein n=1 Tax=Anoxybacillus andreesenii TaxID=1325932 RepID=A0ABT9V890_9BACL|nr:endospore germination permease [Robertmurraya andreesenii]MDQ0157152.1 spore germination protein [Robertmurraya andreesenii]